MSENDSQRKRLYSKPVVTRVRLEDKVVVSMAICKTGPNDPSCDPPAVDDAGNPGYIVSAS